MSRRHRVNISTKRVVGRERKQQSFSRYVKHFRWQTFWAERGLIHIVDERTGEYRTCSRREFKVRMLALRHEIAKLEKHGWTDERAHLQSTLEAMLEVCAHAKRQGDPLAPPTASELAAARQRARELLKEAQEQSAIWLPGQERRPGGQLILPGSY